MFSNDIKVLNHYHNIKADFSRRLLVCLEEVVQTLKHSVDEFPVVRWIRKSLDNRAFVIGLKQNSL